MAGNTFLSDLRYAVRGFRNARGFAAAAVLALALGIGANSAVFSVVDAVLFRPLPYPQPGRLLSVWRTQRDINPELFPDPKAVRAMRHWTPDSDVFPLWRERSRVFEEMAGFRMWQATLTGGAEPERPAGLVVTPGFFKLFGLRPALGRTFAEQEDQPGSNRVVLLAHGLWQRRFASDPNVLGKTLLLDGEPHTILGVMPAGVHLVLPGVARQPDFYGPTSLSMRTASRGRKWTSYNVAARLRPGVTQAQAQAGMEAIAAGIAREQPRRKGEGIDLVPLAREISGESRTAMLVVLGAVGCVLLIACANVANLLLARAAVREREIGLRVVLGAGKWRIVRQTLTESLALALAGGAAGLLLAWAGVKALVAAMPVGTVPRVEDIGIEPRVLLFSLALSLATGLLFGMVPAFEAVRWARGGLSEVLKEGGRTTHRRRLRDALAVAEIAVALVLLAGSGLLIRSFIHLRAVDLGFRSGHVLTAAMMLMDSRYPDKGRRAEFAERVLERVQAVPGIEAAAITNSVPVSPAITVAISGAEVEGRPGVEVAAEYRIVTPDYFRVMGIPLRKGRLFTSADARTPVVMVNQAFLRRYLPDVNPDTPAAPGRKLKWQGQWREIVGVVGDIRFRGPASEATAEVYMPHTESLFQGLALVARTAGGNPLALAPALRSAVRSVDRDQPLQNVATMEQILMDSVARPRFRMLLLGIFAGLALVLAVVGIYGVIAYSVTQQTREIGVRMALGAERSSVRRMVLRHGLALALAGVALGLAGAAAATRVLATFLFGVQALDVPTLAAVAGLLTAITLAACWLPARRASRVDPMVALRYE